jgi:hypothetical protein
MPEPNIKVPIIFCHLLQLFRRYFIDEIPQFASFREDISSVFLVLAENLHLFVSFDVLGDHVGD